MGNKTSVPLEDQQKAKYKSFPGSAILEKTFCGSIDTTDPDEYQDSGALHRLMKRAEILCISSPAQSESGDKQFLRSDDDDSDEENSMLDHNNAARNKKSSAGKLLARALVSEVTGNPKTMKPDDMKERELQMIKAQQAAASAAADGGNNNGIHKPVGTPGAPHVLRSMALACTGDDDNMVACVGGDDVVESTDSDRTPTSPYSITIGLALSRRSIGGHPNTVTRQNEFDFNEIQDREYKYVSSCSGWRAGGGEPSGGNKPPAPDNIHIPIIHIDCPNNKAVDSVIAAMAAGEIFIPHMAVLPEALAMAGGNSPPDLVVKFGCERIEEVPPDDWPNWCLEFMHNQLYEYFESNGAKWMKRPFQITLAQGVRWKTVKHMNKYFANSEQVIANWKKNGPQLLTPALAHIDGGASQEEVAHPHGVYLFRQGKPTNYFAPNFDPPYTTKMTRSLLLTVLAKSWDKKRREWTSQPVPRLVPPSALICGCGDDGNQGYMAKEVTNQKKNNNSKKQQITNTQTAPPMHQPDDEDVLSAIEFGVSSGDGSDKVVNEEKKIEESDNTRYAVPKNSNVSSSHPNKRPVIQQQQQPDDTDNAKSVAHSAYNHSIAGSGTTVMHGNLTMKSSRQQQDQKKSSPTANGSYENEDFLSSTDSSSERQKKNRHSKKTRSRAMGSDESSENPTKRAQSKLDREKVSYTMHANNNRNSPKNRNSVETSGSLEYSTDGSSAIFTQDVSLLGQQFTSQDDQTAPSFARSTGRRPKSSPIDEESSMLSLQDSSSSMQSSVVPTDEELYEIGWAKALDPNSGNYYYFTLDRTKTVWENPLSASSQWGGEMPPPGAKTQQKKGTVASAAPERRRKSTDP